MLWREGIRPAQYSAIPFASAVMHFNIIKLARVLTFQAKVVELQTDNMTLCNSYLPPAQLIDEERRRDLWTVWNTSQLNRSVLIGAMVRIAVRARVIRQACIYPMVRKHGNTLLKAYFTYLFLVVYKHIHIRQ